MKFYIRKRGDIDISSLLSCLATLVTARGPEKSQRAVEQAWGTSALASLSVRSAFDALLASVDWPPGSEVLMSAVTIPHMAELVRLHGYRVVAIDIDPSTMAPSTDVVRAAIGPHTRAVVFAQLFGARHDLAELAGLTRKRGLLLVEDCAQCYGGVPPSPGPADIELYSFGPIKTRTCFGGAISLVRSTALRSKMRVFLSSQPRQSRLSYSAKVVKYALIILASGPWSFAFLRRLLDLLWGDYDRALRAISRGFPDEQLLERLRRRPAAPLLSTMARRLSDGTTTGVRARERSGQTLADALQPSVRQVGASAPEHSHWLFPVVSSDPQALIVAARRAGFDATMGSSALVSISTGAPVASRTMRDLVYLPVYPQMRDGDIERLAAVANRMEAKCAPARLPHLKAV